jgi:hemolysin III
VTHGAGIIASIVGGAVLITLAALSGSPWQITGAAVFAASLVLLYSASTAYHFARGVVAKRRLRMLDHCAIFILIAGTYTPFTLTVLRGSWGWTLFGIVWGLALAGIVFKLFFIGRFPRVSTAIYIGMGWLIVLAAVPLARALDPAVLTLLVIGGLAYTGGTAFYHSRRVPYAHAVWHLFVLSGSVCHAVAVGLQI